MHLTRRTTVRQVYDPAIDAIHKHEAPLFHDSHVSEMNGDKVCSANNAKGANAILFGNHCTDDVSPGSIGTLGGLNKTMAAGIGGFSSSSSFNSWNQFLKDISLAKEEELNNFDNHSSK